MSTIWCIPLPGHPIFLHECPRGTDLGRPDQIAYHITWGRLEERTEDSNTRLTCGCARLHECATFVIDTAFLRAAAHQLRTTRKPIRVDTLFASVECELRLLGLRKDDQDLRPRPASRPADVQAVA